MVVCQAPPPSSPPVQRGRFRTARAQRGHSAHCYGDYPGNNPENHPPCGIMHNQFKTQKFKHLMLAMGPRDLNSAPYSPVHCSSHSMTSFQSSELTELPVVENSQLFAQRAHSTCTAAGTPPKDDRYLSNGETTPEENLTKCDPVAGIAACMNNRHICACQEVVWCIGEVLDPRAWSKSL